MEVVQVFLREGDDAGVGLVADVEEYIHERHFIGGEVADDLAVLLVLDGVGGVDHLGGLVVQIGHLGELTGGELVFQHIAVLGLDVGQTLGGVYFIVAFQLLQHLFVHDPFSFLPRFLSIPHKMWEMCSVTCEYFGKSLSLPLCKKGKLY